MCEPGHRRHRFGNSFCEHIHLPLQINQEGVQPPSPNDFIVLSEIWVLCRVTTPPKHNEWGPILYGKIRSAEIKYF